MKCKDRYKLSIYDRLLPVGAWLIPQYIVSLHNTVEDARRFAMKHAVLSWEVIDQRTHKPVWHS